MRSKKELIGLLLANLDRYFMNTSMNDGLCLVVTEMEFGDLITSAEGDVLSSLWDKLPNYDGENAIRNSNGNPIGYKWDYGKIEPRRKWLTEQLKKY